MIKLKYFFYFFMIAVSCIGATVGVFCVQAPFSYPWWFHLMGMFLFLAPSLFAALMEKTFKDIVAWCERYDQEREDERFLRSKK